MLAAAQGEQGESTTELAAEPPLPSESSSSLPSSLASQLSALAIHKACTPCPCKAKAHHQACNAAASLFTGTRYNTSVTLYYAATNGTIPSTTHAPTHVPFFIPWRYRNRASGKVSWKVFHLCAAAIDGAEAEVVVVDPAADAGLRAALEAARGGSVGLAGPELVEFLLAVVHETLGRYGLEGGPTTHTAERMLHEAMLKQGHNFIPLCTVPIGLCRHKALLFKLLSDVVGLNCALVTGHSTAGRHQWNLITLPGVPSISGGVKREATSFIIDPTSPFFTWTRQGSGRTKAYRVSSDVSFGHGGLTLKIRGDV
ncbi:hypothetical protein HDU87_003901 [Geranomyces variabilis]|uniref:EDR1/CTR1/ARMC3-like peptidase-like domain-containing protein n=1 Tax=Geranomyces variabilis TaxID=109894 RepID=A0AAD5TQN4_9FUNG|nr:hypothetical protein HDU87_003901 [Geranomyces variabilis]